MCVHACMSVFMYYVHWCVCVCVCVSVCVCVCTHVCACICMHMHACTQCLFFWVQACCYDVATCHTSYGSCRGCVVGVGWVSTIEAYISHSFEKLRDSGMDLVSVDQHGLYSNDSYNYWDTILLTERHAASII